jgi:hypothetical protein
MKSLRSVEVPPLSEQRWANIERSLFSRVQRETKADASWSPGLRSRAPLWLAAAALVGAVAALVLVVARAPEAQELSLPSRITTGADTSHLALPGLSLDVEPQSAVVVGPETSQGLLIVVDRGAIACEVAPRPSGAPLVVQAGGTRVRVVGTRFNVSREGEVARVVVHQGVVEVSSNGRTVRVAAGEEWPAKERSGTAGAASGQRSVSTPAEVAGRSAAPAERRTPGTARARAAAEPVTEPDPAPLKPEPTAQEIFEQAAALERRDPGRASQLYGTLESGGDSWAQNALYAHGRLEASRGRHAEARRLLGRYLERFPRGSNAEDARAVLERLRP